MTLRYPGNRCLMRSVLCRLFVIPTLSIASLALQAQGQEQAQGWELLEQITHSATDREVGHPGNIWVDSFVKERFQRYVEATRGPGDAERIEEAEAAYNAALENVIRSHTDRYLSETTGIYRDWTEDEEEGRVVGLRVTRALAQPRLLIGATVILLLLLGITWYFQRRRSLVYVAAGVVISSVLLLVSLKQQHSEDSVRARRGETEIQFQSATEELLAAAQALRDAEAGQWRRGVLTHYTGAYFPGYAEIHTARGSSRIYQLAPNLIEPGNLPGPVLESRLVYAGHGELLTLRSLDLTDAVVLLEFNSENRWINAVEAGATAIIFIDTDSIEETNRYQAHWKVSNSALSVPRFFLRRSELVNLFGDQWQSSLREGSAIRIDQETAGRWERVPVDTDWLFIPGVDGASKMSELVHIQAYKDAASVVPDLSPGAESAINLVALMGIIDDLFQHPPPRPVLISVVNDHTNTLNGEYEFATYALTPGPTLASELERIDALMSNAHLVEHLFRQKPTQPLLNFLRAAIERVAGKSFTVKEPAVGHLMMLRNTYRGLQNELDFRIKTEELSESEREALVAERDAAAKQAEDAIQLLGLFNRFGHRTFYEDLSEEDHQNLLELFTDLANSAQKSAAGLDAERRMIWKNIAFRARLMPAIGAGPAASLPELLERGFRELPSLAMFNLDLGAGNDRLGFFFENRIRDAKNQKTRDLSGSMEARSRRLSRLTLDIAEEHAAASGSRNLLQSTVLKAGGFTPTAHIRVFRGFGSRAFHQFAQTALTLSSVSDQHPFLFTPFDTLANLNRERVERSLAFSHSLLTKLVRDPRLSQTVERVGNAVPFTAEITVRKADQFSVNIPRSVLSNAVVVGYPDQLLDVLLNLEPNLRHHVGQVRAFPVLLADDMGRLRVRGQLWREASLFAFGFDRDNRVITQALDYEENERRFSSTLKIPNTTAFAFRSIVTFDARKSDFYGFTHPRTLNFIREVEVLDARHDSRPRHFSVLGLNARMRPGITKTIPSSTDGTGSIFLPPDLPFKLRNSLENVVVINSETNDLDGAGFEIGANLNRNLPRVMAQDYLNLTAERVDLLETHGVSADSAAIYQEAGAEMLETLPEDTTVGDAPQVTEEARGLAFQSYRNATSIINDLVKAVVLLLALVVPFCFFLVKLLSPFTDIQRQLMLFMGVFAACTALLYFIQPAFQVGERPEVIILAFIIVGLATFVATVLLGKFNAAMTHAVEQSQLSESINANQGRLAGVAFMVGVNNMKRRRIRTALTCATIVLVTFTILSVISVGQNPEPHRLRISAAAPYDGFVYAKPGIIAVNPMHIRRLRAHFEDRADVVTRTWSFQQVSMVGTYEPFVVTPTEPIPGAVSSEFQASFILGLERGERDFLADLESSEYMVPGGRWFSSNNANEIILSRRSAAFIGITPDNFQGRVVELAGERYELVGLYEDDAYRTLSDLRELPFLPLKVDATVLKDETLQTADQGNIMRLPGVTFSAPTEVAFLPIDTAQRLGTPGTATIRTMSVRFRDPGEFPSVSHRAWAESQRFLGFQDVYVVIGLTEAVEREAKTTIDRGQYALASLETSEVSGVLKIAIPVILAAVIILNTMLGAAMERKKEIAIYNAIGLNPTHVMVFFLAEALVFGLVGSVAGYFIGQVLSIGIGQFVDINLNYSSLAVMVVIFLTISTVMLSTLYPAALAARAAVPSGQRKWSVPTPEGDTIHIKFPFSYDSDRVFAICAYLDDFMTQNSEASTGKFLSKLRAVGRVPTSDATKHSASEKSHESEPQGGETLALVYDITPTPFDLGVNQKMEVYADYDARVKAHMLSVHLTREAGDFDSWLTVNQPFLESLRKRLLGWRSQHPKSHQTFYERGIQLFENAPRLAVRDE